MIIRTRKVKDSNNLSFQEWYSYCTVYIQIVDTFLQEIVQENPQKIVNNRCEGVAINVYAKITMLEVNEGLAVVSRVIEAQAAHTVRVCH